MPCAQSIASPSIMPPHLSIVLPFYNEEACVAQVIGDLDTALKPAPFTYEMVAVQNGSRDRTGEILAGLKADYPTLRIVEVPVNQGFGYGLIQGMAASAGDIVGFMPGDGQIDPAVIAPLVKKMEECGADVAQGRRITRGDGWLRWLISKSFNLLARLLFTLPTPDINGHPKLIRRRCYEALDLRSPDSFLDAEILLKGQKLGARFCHLDLEFRRRETGHSSVRISTCLEFVQNLMKARFMKEDPWGLHRTPPRKLALAQKEEAL
jgi:glycosyltransferase involved in cell wall biosynthesis